MQRAAGGIRQQIVAGTGVFMMMGSLGLAGMRFGIPAIFPPLGATAFLVFFSPGVRAATPRAIVLGHISGIVAGYGALWLLSLEHAPPDAASGISAVRVLAAALSVAGAAIVMTVLDASHPPAGATALIVALGVVSRPQSLLVVVGVVIWTALLAIVLNRLAGHAYPLWEQRPATAAPAALDAA